ncbi:unnamed protein product [Clonostachys rhizophaga]|uniref:5'-nucleotidase n=1 Tax=Clonostachys rhizophaga TaxID=160324 RepID=A0A9N9VZI0_9HYPO|nr:unnamed protein product [Clonostachys rhizophaga]
MKSALSLVALTSLVGSTVADEYLFSSRYALNKRDIDAEGNWNVSFFHINDVHAHLDEFSSSGTDCTNPAKGCYGGYSRIKSKVNELQAAHPDSMWINAGDEFQGTMFYSYYGGEKIAEVLNDLEFDIMTLGNHEWDGGETKLGAFLSNLTFPIVSSNVKSENPALKPHIKNYQVWEDKNLAIIGATSADTPSISSVGNQTTFEDPIKTIQEAVYEIRNNTKVKYIVALTHIGYDVDQKLAAETEGIDLIIGAHSHTLLGDMKGAEGKYPTIVNNTKGEEVFIVTSYRWGEYLGSINLLFDKDGKITGYHGAPIHLTNQTAQDHALQAKIDEWRVPFEAFAAEVIGSTSVALDQTKCKTGDCLLGQVMADAMYEYRANQTEGDKKPDFAFHNSGGVRATIDEGDITRGEVLTSFPFGNAMVELTFSGADLRKVFEGLVSANNQFNGKEVSSWFQVSSAVRVEHNPANEVGKRLVKVTIGGEDLHDAREYRLVTLDFLAGGGDNILEKQSGFAVLDLQEDVLNQYIKAHSPMSPKLQERVVKTDGQASNNSNSTGGDSGDQGSGSSMASVSVWTALAAGLMFAVAL